jgi:threonine aldolase
LVRLQASPGEMTWKAGVDLLTYGTTKNGTMNAEAVITFDVEIAKVLRFMHKRAGHLSSKMRYMSAQLLSNLDGDLWRINAAKANSNASRVTDALRGCPGVEITHPVDINEIFAILPPALMTALQDTGLNLRPWVCDKQGRGSRMVMSYCDAQDLIARLETTCRDFAYQAR